MNKILRVFPSSCGFLLCTFVVLSLGPSAAHAAEREHHLGVDGGLSMLQVGDKSSVDLGGGLGAHYAYGVTDQFNFLAEMSASLVALKEASDATTPRTRPTTVSTGGVGVAYVLDVTRYVPYFGVVLGGAYMAGGTIDRGKVLPDAQLALGLDYKLNPSWAIGLAIREHFFFTDTTDYPTYTTGFARAEYTWGF